MHRKKNAKKDKVPKNEKKERGPTKKKGKE